MSAAGQAFYIDYALGVGGVCDYGSQRDLPLPSWDELDDRQRRGWDAVAAMFGVLVDDAAETASILASLRSSEPPRPWREADDVQMTRSFRNFRDHMIREGLIPPRPANDPET